MSSSAQHLHRSPDPAAFAFVEHITLESAAPAARPKASCPVEDVVATQVFESRFHGHSTELSLLGRHVLGVVSTRPDGSHLQYNVDLRLARPAPVRIRNFPWAWALAAVMFGLFGAAAFMSTQSSQSLGLPAAAGIGAVFMLVGLFAAYRSCRGATACLELRSLHGDVPMLTITGGLIGLRGEGPFFEELGRRIEAAHEDDSRTKQQLLCDQMREHQRLFSLGVLAPEQYEVSRQRILAAH